MPLTVSPALVLFAHYRPLTLASPTGLSTIPQTCYTPLGLEPLRSQVLLHVHHFLYVSVKRISSPSSFLS